VEIRKIPYVIHVEEGLENAAKFYSSPLFQWFFTPTLKVETIEKTRFIFYFLVPFRAWVKTKSKKCCDN